MKAALSAPFTRCGLFKQTILQQEASYSKGSLWSNWKLSKLKLYSQILCVGFSFYY